MNVLHLASFNGNIGDNANHSGFRPWFESILGVNVIWTDLEIREFYWKEKEFDDSFVRFVSDFDLLVIGGGNYFELWVEHSSTGTSIDIAPEFFEKIKVPIFFNALGCDEGQGVTTKSVANFTQFLELLVSKPQYLVTVRNDGAMKTLRKHVPRILADKVFVIPDGGFFVEYMKTNAIYLTHSNKRIGINLASDMADIRFKNFGENNGYEGFCNEFASMLENLAKEDPEIHYFFFSHIFRDLTIVSDIISRLSDRLRRTRVSSAPYLSGADGARYIFGLYQQCHLFLGMRFHSNVCSIAMGIPTIGLCNYPQINSLYEEVNYPNGSISVREPGFSNSLMKTISVALTGNGFSNDGALVIRHVKQVRKSFEKTLIAWSKLNGLI
jgi:polysaccharide pyruvyl transferase WcaK-like protein